jgi:hypothetical protein
MKKKILAAVIIIICIISAVFYSIHRRNEISNAALHNNVNNKINTQFKLLSAFADVDLDMVIQDKDPKDDDTSGDYILLKFTNEVSDNKKDNDSNPVYLKSYTFDNKSLPNNTKIYIRNKYEVIIKLKNGYLNGINAPHELVISKNLLDKSGDKIKGSLNLKLPYSDSSAVSSKVDYKNSTNSSSSQNDTKTGTDSSNSNNKSNTDKSVDESKTSTTNVTNKNTPKYTIELGKGLPYATVVMVKLDTSTPQNYKVSVDGNQLELKTDNKGEKVFIKGIKKIYELDQVKKLIKIEKIN